MLVNVNLQLESGCGTWDIPDSPKMSCLWYLPACWSAIPWWYHIWDKLGWPSIDHRSFALVTAAGDPFQRDAHLFTDSDDPLCFGIGIAVELSVVRAQNQDAHLVVVYLAEFVEVQAGDDAHFLIEVALGMEVLAKAGADIGELFEPT